MRSSSAKETSSSTFLESTEAGDRITSIRGQACRASSNRPRPPLPRSNIQLIQPHRRSRRLQIPGQLQRKLRVLARVADKRGLWLRWQNRAPESRVWIERILADLAWPRRSPRKLLPKVRKPGFVPGFCCLETGARNRYRDKRGVHSGRGKSKFKLLIEAVRRCKFLMNTSADEQSLRLTGRRSAKWLRCLSTPPHGRRCAPDQVE